MESAAPPAPLTLTAKAKTKNVLVGTASAKAVLHLVMAPVQRLQRTPTTAVDVASSVYLVRSVTREVASARIHWLWHVMALVSG
jgi:hypothetical protein